MGYYLNEANKWSMDVTELERAYSEATATSDIRVICIINPGNPTGQLLSRQNMEDVVRWAHKKNLFILADEVRYQKTDTDTDKKWLKLIFLVLPR